MNAAIGVIREQHLNPALPAPGSVMSGKPFPPHVDVKRLGNVDFKASRPGAVGRVHEADTQQLVIVVTGPVEDHAGAWQGGDVALRIGCALRQMCLSELASLNSRHRNNDGQAGVDLNGSTEQQLCSNYNCQHGRSSLLTFPLANSF